MLKPEVLAPVGDYQVLQAALQAGADAVYFGPKASTLEPEPKTLLWTN